MHVALNDHGFGTCVANVPTDHAPEMCFIQSNSIAFSHKLLCCKASLLIDNASLAVVNAAIVPVQVEIFVTYIYTPLPEHS
jgi:hypothetical protein